ncbi:uncharacterized protein [Musca autumnalis]|uniref:uncharacterized protein n=1 Tax=Musca autumnalis TaxID=221902 RepID=UPI003CE9E02C
MNKNKKSGLKSKTVEDEVTKTLQTTEKPAMKNKLAKKKNKLLDGKKQKKEKVEKEDTSKSPKVNQVEQNDEKPNLSKAELKKIERKKAKKLAQKLRKAEKKATGGDKNKIEKPPQQPQEDKKEDQDKAEKKKKAKKRKLEGDEEKPTNATVDEQGKNKKKKKQKKPKLTKDEVANNTEGAAEKATEQPTKPDTTKAATDLSERVLKKKERKLKKREALKAQKLAEKSSRDPAQEEATVFVGNLPVNTKRVQIAKLFKKYGPVHAIRLRTCAGEILHKHKMRKAAGALNAYVVLPSKEAAEKALELNGTELKGMHLRVTKSSFKHSASAEESKEEIKRTIFVGNLKYSATEESLRETFSSCGEIEYVRCIRDGDKGCKGVAYVRFKTADAVGLALELNQTLLDDRPINVERYSVRKLGAKEQRDAQTAKDKHNPKDKKFVKGAGDKAKKFNKPKDSNKKSGNNKSQDDGDDSKKSKKSEFRGVKVEALKKKMKQKKKKPNQAMNIAKKIAPRPKNED